MKKLLSVTLMLLPSFGTFAQPSPTITTQPTNQIATAGSAPSFLVVPSGTGPFSYQWQFNGTNIPENIVTVAGGGKLSPGDGGAATNASFNDSGVATDAAGNLFIADFGNNRIHKVDTKGFLSTVAGNGSSTFSGDGGPAVNAGLNYPLDMTFDASGNMYIPDLHNQRIRKVNTNGIITTVAGNGSSGYSGDGGAATNAALNYPSGVAADASGNLYIADTFNYRIRKVDTNGVITTVAGRGGAGGYSGDGGAATNARLSFPVSIAVDSFGDVFVADESNNSIRKVDTNGIITTVAGHGASDGGYSGDGGAATNANLNFPAGVAVDDLGNIFIADTLNNRIRKVDAKGIITTVAGSVSPGYSGDGGIATNATLSGPEDVAVDASGNMFIADSNNLRVRKVPLADSPMLILKNASISTAGNYQVVVTSPYGSVTSAVATLTVLVPPTIVMNAPALSNNNLLLDFNLSLGTNTSFTLLQSPNITGPWTTNSAAILTTNAQSGSFQFSVPLPGSIEFYQLRSP